MWVFGQRCIANAQMATLVNGQSMNNAINGRHWRMLTGRWTDSAQCINWWDHLISFSHYPLSPFCLILPNLFSNLEIWFYNMKLESFPWLLWDAFVCKLQTFSGNWPCFWLILHQFSTTFALIGQNLLTSLMRPPWKPKICKDRLSTFADLVHQVWAKLHSEVH